jgi:FtsP/CotA-like multicopper oxidase with cupredoxin domain
MRNTFLSLGLFAAQFASFATGALIGKPPVIFPVTLTWEKAAPDGFEREMILTNGQFPGPVLNLEEGDTVHVSWVMPERCSALIVAVHRNESLTVWYYCTFSWD